MKSMRLLILIALTANLISCQTLQNILQNYAPEVTLKDAKLAQIDFAGAAVDFKYEMKNKAQVGITFSRLAFDFFVDDNKLVSSDNKKDVSLKPGGTTTFTIRQRIEYFDLADSLLAFYKKDEVLARVAGVVGVRVPQINDSLEVDFEGERKVPVPKLPKVSFSDLAYKSANLNPLDPSARFDLKFKVANPNSFAVNLASLDYAFDGAGKSIVDGQTGALELPSEDTAELSVPVQLRGRNIIDLVPKLRDLSKIDYQLSGKLTFDVKGRSFEVPYAAP